MGLVPPLSRDPRKWFHYGTEADSLESCKYLKKLELRNNALADLAFVERNGAP